MVGPGQLLLISCFALGPGVVMSLMISWMALTCPTQAELDREASQCAAGTAI